MTENICIKCGACCDGTVFNSAKISQDEIIDERYNFLVGKNRAGEKKFQLPCNYLKDKKCTIYECRPYRVCSDFKCSLLQEFEESKISYDDAIAIIDQLLTLKRSIEANITESFPAIKERTMRNMIRSFEHAIEHIEDKKQFRINNAQLFRDIGTFYLMVKKNFQMT